LPVDNKDKNVMVATPENRWGVFVTGSGDFVNVNNNDDNAHGYDITTGTVLVGLDYRVCDHFAIGIDGSYSGGRANLVDGGRIDMDGGQAGAYATIYGFKILGSVIHFDAGVSGGWNDYDTWRTGLQNMRVRGSTDGSEFNAFAAYGGDWHFGRLLVGTWSSLQYTNVNVNDFTETGSLAPLHFPDQSEDSIRSSSGLRLAYDASFGRTIFRPEIRAAWEHEYGDQAYPIDARFASGAGGIFTVHGPSIGRDSALVDAGFTVLWNNRVSTYLFYDGNLGRSNYDNNAVSGGLRVSF
jgi:outer membrane autotransporter protein